MFTKLAQTHQWSHSKLEVLETCPKKFFYKYIAKIKPDPQVGRQPLLLVGNAAHKVIELILRHEVAFDIALKKASGQLLAEEITDLQLAQKHIETFCANWNSFRKKYAGTIQEFLMEASYGIDWDFKPCKFFDNNVAYRGRFDFILRSTQQLIVLDHKFSSSTYKDHTVQLEGYLALLQSYFPDAKALRAGIHYIPLGNTTWGIRQVGYGDVRQKLVERINTAAEKINMDTAVMGRHCGWCDVRFTCQKDLGTSNQFVEESNATTTESQYPTP